MSTKVNKTIQFNTNALKKYKVVTEMIGNIKHIIVPVVMMTEGVRAGNKGPILHTQAIMAASASAWNGMPVTISHPKDDQGNFISAASAGVNPVGYIRGTVMDGNKLRGEVVLNELTLIGASALAHTSIMAGTPLEVSIGAFSAISDEAGDYNGTVYSGITQNYTPDHLALLPGEHGACGWNDGCGIRVNAKNNQINSNIIIMEQKQIDERKALSVATLMELNTNIGYRALVSNLSRMVDSWDGDMAYYYLQEVYDDSFVYRKNPKNRPGNMPTLYKQMYTKAQDDTITLNGDAIPVKENTEYIEITTNNKPKEKTKMKRAEKCTECSVTALIANSLNTFVETDREWLAEQTQEAIDKMTPKEVQVNKEATKAEEKELTAETVTAFMANMEQKDIIALLPVTLQANVTAGLELREKTRTETITLITNNSKEWEAAELQAMECGMLRKIAKTVAPEKAAGIVDYSLNAGEVIPEVIVNTSKAPEPMLPTETYKVG